MLLRFQHQHLCMKILILKLSQLVQPQSKRIEHIKFGQTQCLPQLVRHQSSKTTNFRKVLTPTRQTLQRMLLKSFPFPPLRLLVIDNYNITLIISHQIMVS